MKAAVLFKFKISLFILLFLTINAPLGHSEAVYTPPPVEKVHPPVEKGKKIEKKGSKKLRWKKKQRQAPEQTQNGFILLLGILISLIFLVFIGAFLFGFGIYILPLWIVGLSLMGLGNIVGIIFSIIIVSTLDGEGVGSNIIGGFSLVFLLLLSLLNFAIGLAFLIWGLVIMLPLAWIVGIVLMAIAIIILILIIIYINALQ